MSVEIREIVLKTDINSNNDSLNELTPEQLEQLREELIAQIRNDSNLARKIKPAK